jgi:hypothetical protein
MAKSAPPDAPPSFGPETQPCEARGAKTGPLSMMNTIVMTGANLGIRRSRCQVVHPDNERAVFDRSTQQGPGRLGVGRHHRRERGNQRRTVEVVSSPVSFRASTRQRR